jgi:hypothetical protein
MTGPSDKDAGASTRLAAEAGKACSPCVHSDLTIAFAALKVATRCFVTNPIVIIDNAGRGPNTRGASTHSRVPPALIRL